MNSWLVGTSLDHCCSRAGIASYRKGDWKKAEEDFSRTIILDRSLHLSGPVNVKGGDQEGSLKNSGMAPGLNPKDPSVHNNPEWLYPTVKNEKLQDKIKPIEHTVRAVEPAWLVAQ